MSQKWWNCGQHGMYRTNFNPVKIQGTVVCRRNFSPVKMTTVTYGQHKRFPLVGSLLCMCVCVTHVSLICCDSMYTKGVYLMSFVYLQLDYLFIFSPGYLLLKVLTAIEMITIWERNLNVLHIFILKNLVLRLVWLYLPSIFSFSFLFTIVTAVCHAPHLMRACLSCPDLPINDL